MILSDALSFSRAQTQTDSNGLTDANGIIFANEALCDFHRRLIDKGIDASQLQESYKDGTASQGTYLYPGDMLFLKAIELNYANQNAQDYKVAEQVDVSNLPSGSFGWLRKNASSASPKFDDRGDWYEIFPTPASGDNLTQLIRLFYYLKPTAYTTTGDTVAYPENMDTSLLGWRIAANYLYSLRDEINIIAGDKFNAKYEERIRQYISTLGRGTQQPLQANPIKLSGFEF